MLKFCLRPIVLRIFGSKKSVALSGISAGILTSGLLIRHPPFGIFNGFIVLSQKRINEFVSYLGEALNDAFRDFFIDLMSFDFTI